MLFAAFAVMVLLVLNGWAIYDRISSNRRLTRIETKVDALVENRVDTLLLG